MIKGEACSKDQRCEGVALSAHLGETKRAILLKAPDEGGLGKEQQVQMPGEDHDIGVGRAGMFPNETSPGLTGS